MSKKTPHAATPALKILEEAGVEHSVTTFEGGSDHFGDTAVAALDVEPERLSLIHISEPTRPIG